jgi:hypothetical protein
MGRGWWESAGELREVHVDRDGMSLAEWLGDYALTELAEDYFRVADNPGITDWIVFIEQQAAIAE